MPEYQLSPEGLEKSGKTWTTTILIAYAAITAVLGYSLLYRNGDINSICIFAAVVVAEVAFFIYGRKKYLAVTATTKLIIGDRRATFQLANQADMFINYIDVNEIKPNNDGITLVHQNKKKRSLVITNKFERFDEIEKLLTEKVGEKNLSAAV